MTYNITIMWTRLDWSGVYWSPLESSGVHMDSGRDCKVLLFLKLNFFFPKHRPVHNVTKYIFQNVGLTFIKGNVKSGLTFPKAKYFQKHWPDFY